MEKENGKAYLPLKGYAEGKEALARIEVVKDCLLRGDYIETPSKIASILGCNSGEGELSYLPIEEYASGIVAISRIHALENVIMKCSYGVPTEVISGILGIQLPEKDKPNE